MIVRGGELLRRKKCPGIQFGTITTVPVKHASGLTIKITGVIILLNLRGKGQIWRSNENKKLV